MKILILTDNQTVGGSSTYINNLVHALKTIGHQPTLVTFSNVQLTNKSTHQIFIPSYYSLSSLPLKIFRLFHFLKQQPYLNFDLIITDLVSATLPLLFLKPFFSKLKTIPHFYQFHGSTVLEKQSSHEFSNIFFGTPKYYLHYFLDKFTLASVDKIIVFSQYASKLIVDFYHPSIPIQLVSPGVNYHFLNSRNISLTKSEAKIKLGFDPHTPFFLILGRIEPRKGFVEAVVNFKKYYQGKAQLVFCSNFASAYFNIFPLLDKIGLGSQLKIINSPTPNQLSLLYRAATATLLPSRDLETFGFVSLESLYFQTPVIAFNIGANREIIEKDNLIKPFYWKKFFARALSIENQKTEKYFSPLPFFTSWVKYSQTISSRL